MHAGPALVRQSQALSGANTITTPRVEHIQRWIVHGHPFLTRHVLQRFSGTSSQRVLHQHGLHAGVEHDQIKCDVCFMPDQKGQKVHVMLYWQDLG